MMNSEEDIKPLENYAIQNSIRIIAHLMIDTGMGRMGIRYEDLNNINNAIV